MQNDVDKELEILANVLPTTFKWAKVKDGILIEPRNKPSKGRVIKLPSDIRDKVWDWLNCPELWEDEKEYEELRKPLIVGFLTAAEVIFRYGSPLEHKVFLEGLKRLMKKY